MEVRAIEVVLASKLRAVGCQQPRGHILEPVQGWHGGNTFLQDQVVSFDNRSGLVQHRIHRVEEHFESARLVERMYARDGSVHVCVRARVWVNTCSCVSVSV